MLHLARDVHGVKPLYYAHDADGLRFGSEIKALVVAGRTEPNLAAVNAALLGYSVTWGERTLYRGIRAVRPGEQITYDRDRDTIERRQFARVLDWVDEDLYRELKAAPEREVVRRIDEAITAGVRSRLISDAPLACLASGGVDSSAHRHHRQWRVRRLAALSRRRRARQRAAGGARRWPSRSA